MTLTEKNVNFLQIVCTHNHWKLVEYLKKKLKVVEELQIASKATTNRQELKCSYKNDIMAMGLENVAQKVSLQSS